MNDKKGHNFMNDKMILSRSNCDLFMNDTFSASNYDLFVNDKMILSRSNCDLFINATFSASNYDLFVNDKKGHNFMITK